MYLKDNAIFILLETFLNDASPISLSLQYKSTVDCLYIEFNVSVFCQAAKAV
jgi:hypothetical protein